MVLQLKTPTALVQTTLPKPWKQVSTHPPQICSAYLANMAFYRDTSASPKKGSFLLPSMVPTHRGGRIEQATPTPEALEWWTLESRFWDLFRRIYEFRWKQRDHPTPTTVASLEETRIILTWLMDHAPRNTGDEYIQSNRWMYTREDIKLRKLNPRQVLPNNNVISELDPDAPLRQGKTLHPDDEDPEQTLLKQIFACIRMGDIKKAQEICRDANAHWRAAGLSGVSEDGTTLNNGWRKACLQVARQGQVDRMERAIYGAICGDLDSVTAVCGTWEDQVWAHYNSIYTWKLEEVRVLLCSSDWEGNEGDYGG
jgi:nuclear pore complex protein Nup107